VPTRAAVARRPRSAATAGAAGAAFGLVESLPLAVVALAIAGAADMSSGIFRSTTIWSQTIPDGLRGRLPRIEQLSCSIGPDAWDDAVRRARRVHERPDLAPRGRDRVRRRHVALCALLPRFWRYEAEPVSA